MLKKAHASKDIKGEFRPNIKNILLNTGFGLLIDTKHPKYNEIWDKLGEIREIFPNEFKNTLNQYVVSIKHLLSGSLDVDSERFFYTNLKIPNLSYLQGHYIDLFHNYYDKYPGIFEEPLDKKEEIFVFSDPNFTYIEFNRIIKEIEEDSGGEVTEVINPIKIKSSLEMCIELEFGFPYRENPDIIKKIKKLASIDNEATKSYVERVFKTGPPTTFSKEYRDFILTNFEEFFTD